jgi:hypothetical protein
MTNAYRAIATRHWVDAPNESYAPTTCDVFEQDSPPVDTGLVDTRGVPIFRCQAPRVIGFGR